MSSSHLNSLSDLNHITETIDEHIGMPQPSLGNAPSLERHHSIGKMSESHPLAPLSPSKDNNGGGSNKAVAFEDDYVVKCLPTSDNNNNNDNDDNFGVSSLVGELDGGISDMISRISR